MSKKLEVLYFSAPWCGPCRMFGPAFDEVVAEFKDEIDVKKINVDEDSEASQKYSVSSIPTVIFVKNEKVVFNQKGVMPKNHLKDLITSNK